MDYDIITGAEEVFDIPPIPFAGGGQLPKVCYATGTAQIANQTAAANLDKTFLTLTSFVNIGQYADTTPFTLQSGKVKCALDGLLWADMCANAKTASAYGWLQPFICFYYPSGTITRLQVSHGRGQPSASYGTTVNGNAFMSVTAGTLISIGIVSAQNGQTLGNSYFLKCAYLWSKTE